MSGSAVLTRVHSGLPTAATPRAAVPVCDSADLKASRLHVGFGHRCRSDVRDKREVGSIVLSVSSRRLFTVVALNFLLLLVSASCSTDSGTTEVSTQPASPIGTEGLISGRLDFLLGQPPFTSAPSLAALKQEGRQNSCFEPEFERREPAVWRGYSFEGHLESVDSFYRSLLEKDGWSEIDQHNTPSGQLRIISFEKDFGSWSATFGVALFPLDGGFEILAQDSTSTVCPQGLP